MEFNLDNLIDEYLAGTMDAAAREDFDRRMAADPDLAARVQLERELFEVIGASPENELRANLRQLSEKFDTPESLNEIAVLVPRKQGRNGWVLPVLLLVALVAAFFVFRSMETSPPVSSPVLQQSPPQQQVTPGTPAKEIQQQPSQPDKAVQKSRPVASAYAPIPKLETYIGSQFRSSDFRIVVDAPATGAALKATSGKLNFKLSGKMEGDLPAGASFRVLVFNNNVRDFEKMKPVESSALPVSADGQFLFKKEVPTPPGLYYFLIEEEQSGTWVYVSKFRVE